MFGEKGTSTYDLQLVTLYLFPEIKTINKMCSYIISSLRTIKVAIV